MPATGNSVAAAAGVVEGEVALIPGDEDYRVAGPGVRAHDRTDRVAQERVAGGNQVVLTRKAAWVAGGCAAAMHIVALVGADPGIVRHVAVGEVSVELAEVHQVGHARGSALHVGV